MDNQKWWKKSQSVEINIFEMLKSLCREWLKGGVCAIAFAVLFGVLGNVLVSDYDENKVELTASEQRNLDNAIAMDEEIEKTREYMQDSILMNIDPYNEDCVTLLFSIDRVEKKEKKLLLEAYKNYLSEGGVVKSIKEKDSEQWDNIDDSYLSELILVNVDPKSDKQDAVQFIKDEENTGIMNITVIGKDAQMAQSLSEAVKASLEEYQCKLNESVTEHKLVLLDSAVSIKVDEDLASNQHNNRILLSNNTSTLQGILNNFSDAQTKLYMIKTGKEIEEDSQVTRTVKCAILGFVFGCIAYCGIYIFRYSLSSAVKCEKDFVNNYLMLYIGKIVLKDKPDKSCKEETINFVFEKIKLLCQQQNIKRLMLTTSFALSEKEKNLLEEIIRRLKEENIEAETGEKVLNNFQLWEQMIDNGRVIAFHKLGVTSYQNIDEEMQFMTAHKVNVIGNVILEE